MVNIAKPTIMSLLIQMDYGSTCLATGTGFLVSSSKGPVLITNRHNVTGRDQNTGKPLSNTGGIPDTIRIAHNEKGKLGTWIWKSEKLYEDDAPKWIEHPFGGPKFDLVALPLENAQGIDSYCYEPLNPGPDISCGPAEAVSVIGFPFGMSTGGSLAIWATGFVASEPGLENDQTFLIDCRSRPGQSGSAVIAYRAGGSVALQDGSTSIFNGPVQRFLGVYSGRINSESDLGIVWKASVIAELVSQFE